MTSPTDRKYTKTHEWVSLDGDVATIGVTDFAQSELGDITYLELPEVGDAVSLDQAFGVIESVKAASDVYAPVGGEVVAVNEALRGTPEQVNADAYGAWLFKLKPADASAVDRLLDAAAYEKVAGAE